MFFYFLWPTGKSNYRVQGADGITPSGYNEYPHHLVSCRSRSMSVYYLVMNITYGMMDAQERCAGQDFTSCVNVLSDFE